MSDGTAVVRRLMIELSELYGKEGRPGGTAAAIALEKAAGDLRTPLPHIESPFHGTIKDALDHTPEPIARTLKAAMPYLVWGASDLREGRIPDDLANQMPMCELIGPDGMFVHSELRVGLWVQHKNVVYGPRSHAAEETFLILAGSALWSTGEKAPSRLGAGCTVHHPSNVVHTSVTQEIPLCAAWRWSGEIGFDQYELKA